MAISFITTIINDALDKKLRVAGVFLDLIKAFDTVDHRILLKKCEFYGLRGATLGLLCSYLQNRQQYVNLQGFLSSKNVVNWGVPQGSVLGPTLFLIFINDLPHVVKALPRIDDFVDNGPSKTQLTMPLFADDTTLVCVAPTEELLMSTINAAMSRICTWLKINHLDLNIDKSNFVIFSRSPNFYPWFTEIISERGIIKRTRFTKYLGINVDETLSFKDHVKSVSKILSRNLGIMRKLKHIFPPNVLRLLYFSLIHPYILYCSSIWLGTFPSIVHPIRVIQNNAIRVFCGVGNQESLRSMYRDLNIMPAAGLRDFYTLIFIYRYYRGSLPDCFTGIFCERSDVHHHNTRIRGNTEVPRLVSSRSSFSLIYRASKLWNKLSIDIKEIGSLDQFKSDLRVELLGRYAFETD